MRLSLIPAAALSILLTACSSSDLQAQLRGYVDTARATASDTLVTVRENVAAAVDRGKDVASGVEDRVDKVREGIEMIQRGKRWIREGLQGRDSGS